jgi:hypothetical protein
MVATEEVKVGRPKGKRTERDDVSVKLDRAVASKAKILAGDRGITLAELLTEMLGPLIDKAYLQLMRKLDSAEETAKEGGKSKGKGAAK